MEANFDGMDKNRKREDALKINYIRIISWLQSTICAWPVDEVGQKLHWIKKCISLFLPLQCACLLFGQVHYILNNNLDIIEFGDALLPCMLTTLEIVRLSLPLFKGYREVIRDFIMYFHLIHFKHKGIHFNKIYVIVEKLSFCWTLYMTLSFLISGIFFNVAALFKNYRNGVFAHEQPNTTYYEFAFRYSFPFWNPVDHFKVVTMMNLFYTYWCDIAIGVMDLLVMVMTFHIIGHIIILRKSLESIAGPAKIEHLQLNWKINIITLRHERYTKDENEKIRLILKDCVQHHRLIVKFTARMSHFFSLMLAASYSFHMGACCILLLECTHGGLPAFIRFGPGTFVVFAQLIQISIIFEILSTVSEKLPDTLYSIPWECMDLRNQRCVCIWLQRMQRTIHVTAMGMTTVGVTTMAKILKSTFSYFAFLNSISE